MGKKVGRNQPCPCGSGVKYKKCACRHLPKLSLDDLVYKNEIQNDRMVDGIKPVYCVSYTNLDNPDYLPPGSKPIVPIIDEFLEGPTAIAFGYDDPTGPARVIKEFLKDFDKPSVKGMIFDGEIFTSDQFDKIANLPSKEQLLSKLVGMLNSPMSKLSSVLNSSVSGLLGRLTQLNSKKGN